jgi:DNA-binding LacI/PurR family transcriptional regulator
MDTEMAAAYPGKSIERKGEAGSGTRLFQFTFDTIPEQIMLDKKKLRTAANYAKWFKALEKDFVVARFLWTKSDPSIRLFNERAYYAMQPLFGQALAAGCTAWVGANEVMGVLAAEYLSAKGIKIPQQVSVVSMDDCDYTYQQGLTSYNYAFAAMAQSAVAFVLHPRHRVFGSRNTIETEGFIMERGSAGDA